jgi:hypothetical protein
MGTGGPFSEGKARTGRDADHSHPPSARSRMRRSYTFSHQSAFLAYVGTTLALALRLVDTDSRETGQDKVIPKFIFPPLIPSV